MSAIECYVCASSVSQLYTCICISRVNIVEISFIDIIDLQQLNFLIYTYFAIKVYNKVRRIYTLEYQFKLVSYTLQFYPVYLC